MDRTLYNRFVPASLQRLRISLWPLLGAVLLFSSCSRTSTIAFTHVTVIDPATETIRKEFTVVIDQSRINSVGPSESTKIPGGAKIIDATGRFLMPGLVDMHVHLLGAGEPVGSREFILPLLIANGITTVRDMGGDVVQLKRLKTEIDSGKRLGPAIFFTGPYLDGDPPSFQPSITIHNESEGAGAVKLLKSEGVDFLKVQSRLQPEAYLAIARAARENGMRYVGHVPDSVSAFAASDAGQASIEHLTGILLACSTREDELRKREFASTLARDPQKQTMPGELEWQKDLLNSYSDDKAVKLFRSFIDHHNSQVPTLPLLIHLAFLTPETDRANDPRLKYIPQNLQKIWQKGRQASLANQADLESGMRRQLVQRSLSVVNKMHAAGVPIMAGTDTTAPNVFPGFSLHEDLFYLVLAGLKPMDALRAATSVPAQFLGRASQQGSIVSGQRADLLLLNANPLDDIRNTQQIDAAIVNGKFLNRTTLDEMLLEAERFAAMH